MLDQFKTERERSEAVALREAELAKTEAAKRRAEAQQLEVKQKAEAARQSEELKKAQDELSKAREALASAQREKAAAETAAATARQMQDEARKQTEVTTKGETKVAALPTPDVQAASSATALVRSIQTELKRLRCYKGEVDGQWGKQAQAAYGNYARRAKVVMAPQEPSQLMLDNLLNEKKVSCPLECESGFMPSNGSCVAAPKPAKAERDAAQQAPAKPTVNRPDAVSHSYKVWMQGTASRVRVSKKTEFGILECRIGAEGLIRFCQWQ